MPKLNSMPKIKPCPFCGKKRCEWIWDDFVQCPDCRASGPERKTEHAAIVAWNKRRGEAERLDSKHFRVNDTLRLRMQEAEAKVERLNAKIIQLVEKLDAEMKRGARPRSRV